ncbi:MAG: siderophore-interacting protein [Pseudomonadota bacterium]
MTSKSQTAVVLPSVSKSFDTLVSHISEHGIDAEQVSENHIRFSHEGCVLDFSHDAQQLLVELNAPSENMLFFLKEAAASHIMDIDPVAGENLVWSGSEASANPDGTPTNFSEFKLIDRKEVFPGIIRLTLCSETLSDFSTDGLHVKLMRPSTGCKSPIWPSVASNGMTIWPGGADKLHVRYFTIRHVRDEAGEIDIDVVQHAGGKISDWACSAEKGERIGIMGPGGGGIPRVSGELFLAGDETALPAIARILEELPAEQTGKVLTSAPSQEVLRAYLPYSKMEFHAIEPSRFHAESAQVAAELYSDNTSPDYAWFGGEFSNANAMRKVFKEKFGLSKGEQLSVSYWEMGKRGAADVIE